MLTAKTKVVKQVKKFSDNVGNAKKWHRSFEYHPVKYIIRRVEYYNVEIIYL